MGYPLYYYSPDLFHAWIDITKQSFGIFLTALVQYWTPITITVTHDASIPEGTFTLTSSGQLNTNFDQRLIMMGNHQLYTDWIYLWWIGLTSKCHGALYIMLKESLQKIPIIGWGMNNYRFTFMSRKWETDQKRLDISLGHINEEKNWPAWVVIFPEGTTLSTNGYKKSLEYSKKMDVTLPEHVLLPRAKGLRYCIEKLHGSVEYLYDATIHYSGIQDGMYGEDYFSLKGMLLVGNYPKYMHMHWRRFKVSEIPYQNEEEFEKWLQDRFYEKDEMLAKFNKIGKFDSEDQIKVTAPVKLSNPFLILQIYSVPLQLLMIGNLLYVHLPKLLGY